MSFEAYGNARAGAVRMHGGRIVVGVLLVAFGTAGCIGYFRIDGLYQTKAAAQVEALAMAVDVYTLDCGRIPTREQGLAALWRKPVEEPVPAGWKGPYADAKSLVDPWGRPFEYLVPGRGGFPFGIRSLGADGREGGSGKNRDIASWDSGKGNGDAP
jgi:general secretion pathway protein G